MLRQLSLAHPSHLGVWGLFQTVNTLGVAFHAMSMPLAKGRTRRHSISVGMKHYSNGPKDSEHVYLVLKGRKTGAYETWTECAEQVIGYKASVYRKITRAELAQCFPDFAGNLLEPQDSARRRRIENVKKDESKGEVEGGSKCEVEEVVKKPRRSRNTKKTDTNLGTDGNLDKAPPKSTGDGPVVTIYVDGAARGNPGAASYGILIQDGSGKELKRIAKRLGSQTNNVAEWEGAVAGLKSALELGAKEVHLMSDSNLVVNQISGRWKIKEPSLQKLHAEAIEVVKKFPSFDATWIPRAQNSIADQLANEALDFGDSVWQAGEQSEGQ